MTTVLLYIALLACTWQGADLVGDLVRTDISNEKRDAIVEQLKRSDMTDTAPKVLKLCRDYASPSEPGISSKPWMSDYHSHRAKVWYAAHAIWEELFKGPDDPLKATLLLKLMEAGNDEYARNVILNTMRFHWKAEMEQPVFHLVQSHQSVAALMLLLERCGEPYIPQAVGFVQSAPAKDQATHFQSVFNVGNRFFSYSQENQQKIIALGFSILETEAIPGSSAGYFVARELGYFLKIPNRFSPDNRAPQYQGEYGLNDKFFSDTVQKALEWRKNNLTPGSTNSSKT